MSILTKIVSTPAKLLWSGLSGKKRIIGGALLVMSGAPFLSPFAADVCFWLGASVFGVGTGDAVFKNKKNGKSQTDNS